MFSSLEHTLLAYRCNGNSFHTPTYVSFPSPVTTSIAVAGCSKSLSAIARENSCAHVLSWPSRARPLHTAQRTPPKSSYVVNSDDGDESVTLFNERSSETTRNDMESLSGPDPPFILDCTMCMNSGFVGCSTCQSKGAIRNERSGNVFYCPDCVGHKKLRCPSCGGKCYMCE